MRSIDFSPSSILPVSERDLETVPNYEPPRKTTAPALTLSQCALGAASWGMLPVDVDGGSGARWRSLFGGWGRYRLVA